MLGVQALSILPKGMSSCVRGALTVCVVSVWSAAGGGDARAVG